MLQRSYDPSCHSCISKRKGGTCWWDLLAHFRSCHEESLWAASQASPFPIPCQQFMVRLGVWLGSQGSWKPGPQESPLLSSGRLELIATRWLFVYGVKTVKLGMLLRFCGSCFLAVWPLTTLNHFQKMKLQSASCWQIESFRTTKMSGHPKPHEPRSPDGKTLLTIGKCTFTKVKKLRRIWSCGLETIQWI